MKKLTGLLLIASVMVLTVLTVGCGSALSLGNTVWVPLRAVDASGDEADMNDIYNTHYSNYQGSLSFESNGTFEFWMGPGNPADGSHTGMYKQKDGKIDAVFDNDTEMQFEIRNEGDAPLIVVPYGEYEVYFIKQ